MERTLIQSAPAANQTQGQSSSVVHFPAPLPVASDGREYVKVYSHRVLVLVEDRETGRHLEHIVVQAETEARLLAKLDNILTTLRFNWVPRDRIEITWKEV